MESLHITSEKPLNLLTYTPSRVWIKICFATILLFHAVFIPWLLIRPFSAHIASLGNDIAPIAAAALSAIFCFFPVADSKQQPLRKSCSMLVAWLCALSMLLGIFQGAYWIWVGSLPHPSPIPRAVPDIIGLLAFPLLLAGIWWLPHKQLSTASQIRISLDGLMVTASVLTFSWYFILGPTILASKRGMERTLVDASYPLMDVLQIACLLFLGRRSGYLRSVFLLLTVAFVISVASDSIYVYTALHQRQLQGTLLEIGWTLANMLVGTAVFAGRQPVAWAELDDLPERLSPLWTSLLPYALLPLVGALVVYTEQVPGRTILKHGVFWGALVLICLILVRQMLALLENRELNGRLEALATTDPLTGLCNHRTFHARLTEEAAAARAGGSPLAVVMLDLDNFKFFNDGYGHAAGDDVLRQVTRALREVTAGQDTLGRFGGDEFALLLPLPTPGGTRQGQTADELRLRLEQALSGLSFLPPGSPSEIPLTISVGVALFPAEAGSALDALELADRRLLHAKTGGGSDNPADSLYRELAVSLSGFPMLNALVTAVDNKDRYTRRHSEDVLTYSLQIADEFGLDPETRRTVQVAALLHDVGKIGVPDRVLRKPGALTNEEHQAVQQHPAMGAAIVGAVPGFEDTLDTVRYHHERWDGGGYPAGLTGEETPFLARIVAVADAFSAMTTDRPYRRGMKREKAMRILNEGAGTQWDPDCIAALLRVYQPAEHSRIKDSQAEHSHKARLLAA